MFQKLSHEMQSVNMENLVYEEKWLPTATAAIMRLLKEWMLEWHVDKEFPGVNNYCTGVVPSVRKTISHAVTPP